MTSLRGRLRDRRGQATVELITMLPWLAIAALVAVQLQLFVSTHTSAEHAARNASRAARAGEDAFLAARQALHGSSASRLTRADVRVDGERVTVDVLVPFVLPGLPIASDWTVTRDARLPQRAGS